MNYPAGMHTIEVTPEMAERWLQMSKNVRKLEYQRVDKYASDMERDAWDLNGESIKIDADGYVRDGQHRLAAIIKSGRTVTMYVFFGMPPKNADNIDTGQPRKLHHLLAAAGIPSANGVAATTTWYWRLTHPTQSMGTACGVTPTFNVARELLDKHPGLVKCYTEISNFKTCPCRPSLLAAVFYIASSVDAQKAREFVTAVGKGLGLSENHPAHRFRVRLEKFKASKYHVSQLEQAALLIKAWRLFLNDSSIDVLSWRAYGPRAEGFPSIVPE